MAGMVVNGHYEQINNILLNEFFNEHKKVHASEAIIAGNRREWRSSDPAQTIRLANPKSGRAD